MEMWNVLLGLSLWGHMWKRKEIVVKCDNQAVVSVINTGVTRDSGVIGAGDDSNWIQKWEA